MKKIYIPFDYNEEDAIPIWRQFPNSDCLEWNGYTFTFDEGDDYDYIAVIDNITHSIPTKVPKECCYVFLGEPPSIKKYSRRFLRQFGHVHTCVRNDYHGAKVTYSFPALPWMGGCNLKQGHDVSGDLSNAFTYRDFLDLTSEERLDRVCIITSNKKLTEGHRDRVAFVNRAISEAVPYIDVYGNGYDYIEDKLTVLRKYKYCLVIENGCFPDYWSEKLADCILAGCYPIYCGATNIEEYFSEGLVKVDIRDYCGTLTVLEKIIKDCIFDKSTQEMRRNKKLILDDYNCFNIISQIIKKSGVEPYKKSRMYRLSPSKASIPVRVWLRMKRILGLK